MASLDYWGDWANWDYDEVDPEVEPTGSVVGGDLATDWVVVGWAIPGADREGCWDSRSGRLDSNSGFDSNATSSTISQSSTSTWIKL